MYLELLKELYYQERKKLEEMGVYKQEAKLKLIGFRRGIVDRAEENLTMSELLGRSDIAEEIKDNLLRDSGSEDKIKERLNTVVNEELSEIDNEQKEELKRAAYPASEFADYLYQLEKVSAIESELENNRLFPADVYIEQKEIQEGRKSEK
jgi:hypothetical protein